MPERSGYVAGTPSWVDVAVPELEPAKAFYGRLFDWEFDVGTEEFGFYTMCRKQGKAVTALMPIPPGMDMTPAWNTYLATDDLDATVATARDAGATVTAEPMDVGVSGRMAYLLDPAGAAIGLWQAREHTGAELVNEPDSLGWNELSTPDPAASDAFYGRLFPYEFEQVPGGFDYALLKVNGGMVAGRMAVPAGTPAGWNPYFAVADVDKVAATAAEAGGAVLREPEDSPFGRFGLCQDPFGATFSILTPPAG